MIKKLKQNTGAIALMFVIMITTITLVSSLVVSLVNISDLFSHYQLSEAEEVNVYIDACLDDALFRLASSTSESGTYYLSNIGTPCYYQLDSVITNGLKIVTSTASTTSDVGNWENTAVIKINVSTTPMTIYSYKNSLISYDSY